MNGYVICLTDKEGNNFGRYGWPWIAANRSRLKPFSYEESSIDLGFGIPPRFIVDDRVYEGVRQYFNRVSDTETERIFLLKPIDMSCETVTPM